MIRVPSSHTRLHHPPQYRTAALQTAFANRERARDAFLKLLRDFATRGASAAFDPAAHRAALAANVRAFFAALAPCNVMWYGFWGPLGAACECFVSAV